jgi:hypothetical protein
VPTRFHPAIHTVRQPIGLRQNRELLVAAGWLVHHRDLVLRNGLPSILSPRSGTAATIASRGAQFAKSVVSKLR